MPSPTFTRIVHQAPFHDPVAIQESRRADIPVPGPLMAPLYGLRRWLAGFEFRYDMNVRRFHFGGVLDGSHARSRLGFEPRVPARWPKPWWRVNHPVAVPGADVRDTSLRRHECR